MPLHDWTRVEAGIFHDFHVSWVPEIKKALNAGLLPDGYYALAEQHFGRPIADVLTLHASAPESPDALPPATGGVALAEAPPKVRRRQVVEAPAALSRRRSIAIRHVSGPRLVALLELVSPANKDRPRHIDDFAGKIVAALASGIHVLVVDLLPPGPADPQAMHGAILERLDDAAPPYDLLSDEPITFASYLAANPVEAYLEHGAVNCELPDMPLFIRPDRYVNIPLESTYRLAYESMPQFWREVLEGKREWESA